MRTIVLQQFALVISALVLLSPRSSAQDPFTQADSNLNQAYKQSLTRFTKSGQEPLRQAERAWIPFSDKDEAFLNALQRNNRLPDAFAGTANILEVNSRAEHLRIFYCRDKVPWADADTLRLQDERLTSTYLDCMKRLSSDEQLLLKESERAWITYRDADAAGVKFTYSNDTVKFAAAAHLTALRTAQLTAVITSLQPVSLTGATVQSTPVPPPPDSTPNPDDVKAVSQFQQDSKGVLNSLLKNKDAPFFKKADAIKNVPDLPSDMPDQISKLDSRMVEFSSRNYSSLVEQANNEFSAVQLLAEWMKFTRQLKNGSVEDAGTSLRRTLNGKPKEVTPDYVPIWKAAQDWLSVYDKDLAVFRDHIQKAKTAADLGKTSEAIKEYQAAYEIIENASIPEKIKKLREQSLGL